MAILKISSAAYDLTPVKTAVLYTQQDLTNEQRAQARTNIGAFSQNGGEVGTNPLVLTGTKPTLKFKVSQNIQDPNNNHASAIIQEEDKKDEKIVGYRIKFRHRSFSEKINEADGTTEYQPNNCYENFSLPYPSIGLTESKYYTILTNKTPVLISQGGTGAKDAPTALSNLGALSVKGGKLTGELILGDIDQNLACPLSFQRTTTNGTYRFQTYLSSGDSGVLQLQKKNSSNAFETINYLYLKSDRVQIKTLLQVNKEIYINSANGNGIRLRIPELNKIGSSIVQTAKTEERTIGENSVTVIIEPITLGFEIYSITTQNIDSENKGRTKYFEKFSFPPVDNDRSQNASFKILTTKNLITIEQGGTGANNAKDALSNLGIYYGTNEPASPEEGMIWLEPTTTTT